MYNMKVYFDESGNTGLDLLSADQPLFSLASTSLEDEISWVLMEPLLRQGQVEAKYSTLKRSNSGQQALLTFFDSAEFSEDNINFKLVHKKFSVCCQIVDKLIEPVTHELGIDLYARDLNVWTANLLHYTGEHTFSDGLWDRFLSSFVYALRNDTEEAYNELEAVLDICCNSVRAGFESNSNLIALARGRCGEFLSNFPNRATFDPASDMFVSLVQDWMRSHNGNIDVLHDASKPMARMDAHLRTLMTPVAPRTIGQGDRVAEFPLRVGELRFVNSRDHPSVQLADLFAGAAIDCLRSIGGERPSTQYHRDLIAAFDQIFTGGILPSPVDQLGLSEDVTAGGSVLDGVNEFLAEVRASQK